MFNITHYFEWNNTAAVVGNVNDTEATGFFLNTKGEWNRATPLGILEFFNAGSEMDKDTFEKNFGVIGQDLPALPALAT